MDGQVVAQPSSDAEEALFSRRFTMFRTQMTDSMREVAGIVQNSGPSAFLIGFGTTLLLLAVSSKVSLVGIRISQLEPSEFITIALIAFLLIAGGTALRVLQFYIEQRVNASIRAVGERLLVQAHETSTEMAQHGSNRATTL